MSTNRTKTRLGGYQEAADVLQEISGRNWSRQGVQRMHQRRDANGFPDRRTYEINGRAKELFTIADILDWYAFSEAAQWMTDASAKLWFPSDAWKLWRDRKYSGFPDRTTIPGKYPRKGFDESEIRKWIDDHGKSDS